MKSVPQRAFRLLRGSSDGMGRVLGRAVMASQCRGVFYSEELLFGAHSSVPCVPALLLDSGPQVSFPPQQPPVSWRQTSVTVCAQRGNMEPCYGRC